MRIWTATVDRIRRESAATKSFSLLRCVCVSTFCVDCTCCQLSNVLIDQQRFVFYFFSPPSFALFPLPDASFRSQLSEPIRAGRSVRETGSVSCVLTCFDHFLGQRKMRPTLTIPRPTFSLKCQDAERCRKRAACIRSAELHPHLREWSLPRPRCRPAQRSSCSGARLNPSGRVFFLCCGILLKLKC